MAKAQPTDLPVPTPAIGGRFNALPEHRVAGSSVDAGQGFAHRRLRKDVDPCEAVQQRNPGP